MKSNRDESARFGVGRTEYVEAMPPTRGLRVRVMVYGKEECEILDGSRREAAVPVNGLPRDECDGVGII